MSDLWTTWVGNPEPAVFLRITDRAIASGKFASRQEAFLDLARTALRLRQPDIPDDCTPESLAQELQEFAEGSENVSP